MFVFVSGGVRSGKSRFSETLAARLQISVMPASESAQVTSVAAARKIYLATGVATDNEMATRIDRHKVERSHAGWVTMESPFGPAPIRSEFRASDTVLMDCATTWLANLLYGQNSPMQRGMRSPLQKTMDTPAVEDIAIPGYMLDSLLSLQETASHIVVVSNDVFSGLYASYDLETQRYIRLLGTFHCQLAAIADTVVECISGIPICRKGVLP